MLGNVISVAQVPRGLSWRRQVSSSPESAPAWWRQMQKLPLLQGFQIDKLVEAPNALKNVQLRYSIIIIIGQYLMQEHWMLFSALWWPTHRLIIQIFEIYWKLASCWLNYKFATRTWILVWPGFQGRGYGWNRWLGTERRPPQWTQPSESTGLETFSIVVSACTRKERILYLYLYYLRWYSHRLRPPSARDHLRHLPRIWHLRLSVFMRDMPRSDV